MFEFVVFFLDILQMLCSIKIRFQILKELDFDNYEWFVFFLSIFLFLKLVMYDYIQVVSKIHCKTVRVDRRQNKLFWQETHSFAIAPESRKIVCGFFWYILSLSMDKKFYYETVGNIYTLLFFLVESVGVSFVQFHHQFPGLTSLRMFQV